MVKKVSVRPMLARAATEPPRDGAWAYELKWDGIRALGHVEAGTLRIESRNGKDLTPRFPELKGLATQLGAGSALLDGEIVAFDDDGRPSLDRLQQGGRPATYVLFDLLELDGRPTLELPYAERRRLLAGLALEGPSWRTPEHHEGQGRELLEATRGMGLEGVMAKRLDSRYEPGRRSGAWLKIKNRRRAEVVIGGYTRGSGERRGRIGALLAGRLVDGRLLYAGRIGTGFSEETLRTLERELEPLRRETSPFEGGGPPRGAVFCEPELVAEVELAGWTRGEMLRAASFVSLRRALPAGEVRVDGRTLRLSNLQKVLYPATGFTKGAVVDYYRRVAPALLPHLRGRPLTLKRYPDGVDGESFYEKRCPSHRPPWVPTADADGIEFCVAADLPTLVWVANLASLELHTSLSLAAEMARPTMLVFDLDPGEPAGIAECATVALRLRALFDRLGLACLAKTSGSKGLQVYVPLNSPLTYAETKPFAHAVARLLEEDDPELVVSRMTKELRRGKVLVDWSQNDRRKTTVCAYSLRARERPTVSTPLTWEEVESGELSFEAAEVLERVNEHGDLFAPVLELRQELPSLERR
jgi:bifunctional non-homologous end joining protein LigD